MGDLTTTLKNILYALLGIGAVGGMVYMTGAGTFPTSTPEVTPFPVNKDLVEFYTAACDVQAFTNQNKSLSTVEYLISATELSGDPSTFSYTTMTRATNDWSRWSAGGLQNTPYYCYIHVAQNEVLGITNYYFNFTRSPNTNLVGDVTWSSGTYSGTYNYRSLTVTGPVTLNGNTTINLLQNMTITPTGQIAITSVDPAYSLNITAYDFVNEGTILGSGTTGYTGSMWYQASGSYDCYAFCSNAGPGYPGAQLMFSGRSFTNIGTITFAGGTGGFQPAGAAGGGCYGAGSHFCRAGMGGHGGTIIINTTKTVFNNSGTITLNAGNGGDGTCASYYNSIASDAGPGGVGGNVTDTALMNTTVTGLIRTNGGNGGNTCAAGSCGDGGNGGSGGTNVLNISSGVVVTQTCSATGGTGGAGGAGCSNGGNGATGSWTVSYCANGTGMDWSKFVPTATTNVISCLVPPTTGFLTPNATTSLLTLSNNLTANLSTSASELSYRFQISLNNGSTWVYVTEATNSIPSYFNRTTVFDVYLMNATPNALMRVLAFNNTSKIFGGWTPSLAFYLLNRNTSLNATTSPVTITSTPFTLYCNYTSNGTVLQDAAARVYIDSVPYDMSYDFTTGLYRYAWASNTSITAGNHSYYCWANKGNFNVSQSAPLSFSINGFAVYYAGGNGTRFFCPFPTYPGAYPAYQTAGKGAIRVQNYNITNNKNYTAYLQTPMPSGLIVYARCDKLSPSASGWTVLTDISGYRCWSNINSTNIAAYMWLKGDCIGAAPGAYVTPQIVVVEN